MTMRLSAAIAVLAATACLAAAEDVIKAVETVYGQSRYSVHPTDGRKLFHYRGDVYLANGDKVTKLMQGEFPIWHPDGSGHFLVFLDIGYDGLSEIWLADTKGRYILKVAEGYLNILSKPKVSPSGKLFMVHNEWKSQSIVYCFSLPKQPTEERKMFWIFNDWHYLLGSKWLAGDKIELTFSNRKCEPVAKVVRSHDQGKYVVPPEMHRYKDPMKAVPH